MAWNLALAAYPFAGELLPHWQQRADAAPAAHLEALEAVLAALDTRQPKAARYRQLCLSHQRLKDLAEEGDQHLARRLLHLRVLQELGAEADARGIAEQLAVDLARGATVVLDRPMLPVHQHFDRCPPSGDIGPWISAQILHAQEWLSPTDSDPQERLARLSKLRRLPCSDVRLERRLALAGMQAGKTVNIGEGSRVLGEGWNRAIWSSCNHSSEKVSTSSQAASIKAFENADLGIVLPPKEGNKYGVHSNAIEELRSVARERGLKVKLLPNDNETDRIAIARFTCTHEAPLIFGVNGWELPLCGKPLIEHIENRAYGRIGDHPFARFMHQRVLRLNRNLVLSSPSFDWEEGAKLMNPSAGGFLLRRGWVVNQDRFDRATQVESSERDIDVLVPLDFRDTYPSLQEIIDKSRRLPIQLDWASLYDDLLKTRTLTPLRIFVRHFREKTGQDFTRWHLSRPSFFALLSTLSDLDFRVRGDRRVIALQKLASHKHLKIVVLSNRFTQSPDGSHIHYVGKRSFQDYLSLVRRSRMALNVAPTYPDVWPERIPVFMGNGCATITDWHPLVEEKRYQDKDFARTTVPIEEFDGGIEASAQELRDYFEAHEIPEARRLFLDQVLNDYQGHHTSSAQVAYS